MALFPVFYGGNIAYFQRLMAADQVVFEVCEHFPKQTFRNRMEIVGPNGLQKLVIPTLKTGDRRRMDQVEISYEENWQKDHWKGMEAAYRRSPFFEFYEDSIRPFYKERTKLLIDFNLRLQSELLRLLQLELSHAFTQIYTSKVENDFRNYPFNKCDHEAYLQVFSDRQPFYSNLSVMDALFNLGPGAKGLIVQNK